MLAVTTGVTFLLSGWLLWRLLEYLWLRLFYDLHRLPSPKGELPFFGHALQLPTGDKPYFAKVFMDFTLEQGKIWRLNLLGRNEVIVTDREFFHSNIYGPGAAAQPKGIVYEPIYKLSGAHRSFVAEKEANEKYRAFRKPLAVAFSSQNLRKNFPVFLEKVNKMVNIVDASIGKESFDIQRLGVRFAFESVAQFFYGLKLSSLEHGHLLLDIFVACSAKSMREALNPLHGFLVNRCPFTRAARESKADFQELNAQYVQLFKQANVDEDEEPAADDHSILACLKRIRKPSSKDERISKEEMIAEFGLFMLAGTDTTGHQIGWTMMWLAGHPEIQDKIYAELQQEGLAGSGCRDLSYEDLANLKYLKMTIMEALRMTPAVSTVLTRCLKEDTTVMGYRLPKGTNIGAFISAQNNVPWLWKDPNTFRPERWTKENESERCGEGTVSGKGKELWSFGSGDRSCVGQRLAMLELQMVFAVLISKFKFFFDPRMGGIEGTRKMTYNALVETCDGGIWIKAKRREAQASI